MIDWSRPVFILYDDKYELGYVTIIDNTLPYKFLISRLDENYNKVFYNLYTQEGEALISNLSIVFSENDAILWNALVAVFDKQFEIWIKNVELLNYDTKSELYTIKYVIEPNKFTSKKLTKTINLHRIRDKNYITNY